MQKSKKGKKPNDKRSTSAIHPLYKYSTSSFKQNGNPPLGSRFTHSTTIIHKSSSYLNQHLSYPITVPSLSPMKIQIRHLATQQIVTEDCSDSEKIIDIKRRIQHKFGTQPLLQTLMFHTRELQNHTYFNDEGDIGEEDELMLITMRFPMAITVSWESSLPFSSTIIFQVDDVTPSTTISQLEDKIQEHFGFLPVRHRMYFAGKILRNRQATISNEHIYHLSRVEIKGRDTMNMMLSIHLRFSCGRRLSKDLGTHRLLGSETIGRLKELIGDMEPDTGIKMRHQKLIFQGRELRDDDKCLTNYCLRNDSIITLANRSKYGDMEVYIKVVPTGKILCLEVKRNNTIGELKNMIQKKEDIPIEHQILYFPLQHLTRDNRTLNEYHVDKGAQINLVFAAMQIYVQIPHGEFITLWTQSYMTIYQLKKMLRARKGYESRRQRLFLQDVELRNDQTIETSRIYSHFKLLCEVD